MGIMKQVAEYLYLRKKDPDAPQSNWLSKMHFINRLSILMFLVCLVVMIVRAFLR